MNSIMKKHLMVAFMTIMFCVPGDARYISVNLDDGIPSPVGTEIDQFCVYPDNHKNKRPPAPLLEFFLWEIKKAIHKNVFKLTSLPSSESEKMDQVENFLAKYYPMQLLPILPDLIVDRWRRKVTGYDRNLLFARIGKGAEQYDEMSTRYRQPFGQKIISVDESYEIMIKGFKDGSINKVDKLYDLFRSGKDFAQVIRDIVERKAVNEKNFKNFMELMRYADFPETGAEPVLKYWKRYVYSKKGGKVNSWHLSIIVIAVARNQKLAEQLVPKLAAPVEQILTTRCFYLPWLIAYWSKAAKVDCSIELVKKFLWSDRLRFAENWAIVTGNGDQAYSYVKKSYVPSSHRDSFFPSSCLNLLFVKCQMNEKNISEIFNNAIDVYKGRHGHTIPRRHDGKTFTPQCYNVIDKAIKRSLGDDYNILYEMQIYQFWSRAKHLKLKYTENMDGKQKKVFDKRVEFWEHLSRSFSLCGFLYGVRKKDFFEFLWNNKTTGKAHKIIMSGGPLVVPMLIGKISDEEPYTSIEACDFISKMGTYARNDAVQPLLDRLKKSRNRFVRSSIVKTLGEIKAEEAIPYLKNLAKNDKDKLIRINAKQVLMLFKKLTLKDIKKIYADRKRKALNNLHR